MGDEQDICPQILGVSQSGPQEKFDNFRLMVVEQPQDSQTIDGATCKFLKGSKLVGQKDAYLELDRLLKDQVYFLYVEFDRQTPFCLSLYGPCGEASPATTLTLMDSAESQHQILSNIFLSKISLKSTQFLSMVYKGCPLIKRYCNARAQEGYNYVIIKNGEKDHTYHETFDLTDNMELVKDESADHTLNGRVLSVSVAPGTTKAIIFKITASPSEGKAKKH